jgi:signal peptide peptidase SppA
MFNNQYLMIDELYLNGITQKFTPAMIDTLQKTLVKMEAGEAVNLGKPVLQKEGSRAMISIDGPMMYNPSMFDKLFYQAVSTQEVQAAILDVANDPKIKAVVNNINSPGGEAHQIHKVAADMAQLSNMKAVASLNTGMMCSAAYFIGSQAGNVFSTDGLNETGSIGTVKLIADHSKAAEMAGIKIHKIATGELKAAGAMGTELTTGMIAHIQKKINKMQESFSGAVSSKRSNADMSDGSEARSGASFFQEDAERLGLSDGVKSIEEAFQFLEQGNRASRLRQSI